MKLVNFVCRVTGLLACLLLVACSHYAFNGASAEGDNPAASLMDFDELLDFSSQMASLPVPARTDACRRLRQVGAGSVNDGVSLQLLVGRLFSDACGDIGTILNTVEAIPAERWRDERLKKLVLLHTEALKRLPQGGKKSSGARKSKVKQGAGSAEESPPEEVRLLREKLEAIRRMEKQMDGAGN